MSTVEIYGLFEPDTGDLRYVGKAKDTVKRLKSHLRESRTGTRPVHNWIRKLALAGKIPKIEVLEVVRSEKWAEAEIRLIAEHRKTANLLNVADGGDMPAQTPEQKKRAGERGRRAIANAHPALKRLWDAKRDLTKLANRMFREKGGTLEYWCLRMRMHNDGLQKPHLFGDWVLPWRT
jgi:hypothetical protein